MRPEDLRALLERVRGGAVDVDAAMHELAELPFRELEGVATVDHHRALRTGVPEVVFGQGKTPEQIAAIVAELARRGGNVLATRVSPDAADAVRALVPEARYEALARCVVVERQPPPDLGRGTVVVVCAGTSDLPVAEEAALTARLHGSRVERVTDVGVAGLHRLLPHRPRLEAAEVIVVVAGMEAALPSVVKGLVSRPVIGVPTSVGYGTSFGGVTALLGMLNACASGIVVVNIDNGFGGGLAAALINRRREAPAP
jgi:hypothetical protein